MNELKMYTQEEVAILLHAPVSNIAFLREIGIIRAIRTGRNYMFSYQDILQFQNDYIGLDVSNKVKAIESYNKVKQEKESAE